MEQIKIKTADFFRKLAEERPGAVVYWVSTLESDHSNVIRAVVSLDKYNFRVVSHLGNVHYPETKDYKNISSREWVDGVSLRALADFSLEVRTFLI